MVYYAVLYSKPTSQTEQCEMQHLGYRPRLYKGQHAYVMSATAVNDSSDKSSDDALSIEVAMYCASVVSVQHIIYQWLGLCIMVPSTYQCMG